MQYAWMHNLPGNEPAQPQGFQGQGSWLRCLPRGTSTTMPDCVCRWGLQQRLSCDAPGASRQCARPGRGATLDAFGVHVASCNWGQVCRRHDKLRDLLAQAARLAGMAAITEQNVTTVTLQELFVGYIKLMFASLRMMADSSGWTSKSCPPNPKRPLRTRSARQKSPSANNTGKARPSAVSYMDA